jgi:hypothetical protein
MTAIFATAFFVSSLTLAYLSSQHIGAQPGSLLDEPATDEAAEAAPADEEPQATDELPSIDDGVDTEDTGADEALPEVPDEQPAGE